MRAQSLVNGGLFRNSLKRFWPLWLIYFIVMMLLLVAPVYTAALSLANMNLEEAASFMDGLWSLMKLQLLFATLSAGIIVALCLNEHLFTARAATFYGSLPAKRDSVFATLYLAGFAPQVAVLALVAVALLPLCVMHPAFSLSMVGQWLLLSLALTFVFYSLAQLICQLTGNRVVALLLYTLANTLAACLEMAVRLVIDMLQYGGYRFSLLFKWAAPAVGLGDCLESEASAAYVGQATTSFITGGTNYLGVAAYCLAAVAFVALAVWLNRRRNLETAGDTIALPALRPVLSYLAGISAALLLASFFFFFNWLGAAEGTRAQGLSVVWLAVVMAVGGFLGLLFSEMAMAKSTRVLASCWKGSVALAVVSVLLVATCSFDLLGFARYVPAPSKVASVEITSNGLSVTQLSSEEAVEAATQLHRDILAYGGDADAGFDSADVGFVYHLSNGLTVERSYPIAFDPSSDTRSRDNSQNTPGFALLCRADDVANTPEGLAWRYAKPLATEDNGYDFLFEYSAATSENSDVTRTLSIPNSQKADFIENALKPDILEHHAADYTFYYLQDDESYEVNDLGISFSAYSSGEGSPIYFWLDGDKTPNTVRWLKRHYPDIVS